ncbi:MAG TPA: molybdopterin cofactor-binding domain-containing protein [Micropepsaceae bacterium]|nr:molybdopterin cofactor-binding domain-containing protein [Micropepsaceae bacterium]
MTIHTTLSRRQFVVSTLTAAGGFALGVGTTSAEAASLSVRPWNDDTTHYPGEINAWVVIQPDDTVIIRYGRAEMGQGSFTALPQILAEELECDWQYVRPEYASANRNVRDNKVYGSLSTGGSRAVRETGVIVQQAGASARERLIAAAAKRWNVPATECEAAMSKITHKPSGRTFRFGELAAEAAAIKLDKEPALKHPDQYKFIGRRIARLDIPLKINGTAKYGIDLEVPGMVRAAVMKCPVFGGTLKSADESKIASRRGIIQVVKLKDAVAVVADRTWRAQAALKALPIEWEVGAAGATNSAQFRKAYLDALDQKGAEARHDGNVDGALAKAAKVIEATYDVPIIAHAPMEPLNAIAHVQADRVDVWVGTQNADLALTFGAQASGMKPENVYVHNTFSGGGFGRRLGPDEVAQAVAISKAVGKPVKLVWTREEEIRQGRYRTQAAIRFKAGFAADGTAVALEMRNSAGAANPAGVKDGIDPQTLQGLINAAYQLPNYRVISMLKNTHVPLGPWRAPGHSQNAFFMESFIDEMAHAAGKDPVQLRRQLLAHRPDFQQVLDVLVEKGDWGTPLPRGRGRGIAITEAYDSIVGMIVEVTVKGGQVKADRVVIACDCGTVVNPRGVETQLEGGMIYGLSAALFGNITIKDGRVEQGNFDTYPVVRFKDAPKTEVYISPTPGKRWGGVGEPGATVIQPALTNAIFAATGRRLRSLPVVGQDLNGAV